MPTLVSFHDWRFAAHEEETRSAYSVASGRGAAECDCAYCRNFVVQRIREYPSELVGLLNAAGVDHLKEAEVWEVGPLIDGRAYYSGWWHFIGEVVSVGSSSVSLPVNPHCGSVDWTVAFRGGDATLKIPSLPDAPLILVEFSAMIPWILDEPYPS